MSGRPGSRATLRRQSCKIFLLLCACVLSLGTVRERLPTRFLRGIFFLFLALVPLVVFLLLVELEGPRESLAPLGGRGMRPA